MADNLPAIETHVEALPEGGALVVTEVPAAPVVEGEVIEAVSSDAVAIAQIEADASVTIAAIHADTETAAIEARAESERLNNEMRDRNTWLEAEIANTQERNRVLEAQIAALTPPPSQPETVEEMEVVNPETIVTSETLTEALPSTETEAPSESEAESPAEVVAVILAPQPARRTLKFL